MGLLDEIRTTAGKQITDLAKWTAKSDDDVSFSQMNEALTKAGLSAGEPTEEKPRGMFHDPYSVADWGGWRQRPSSLTYETLRQMSVSNTMIAAIIGLRVNQVAQFARPQQGVYDKGFKIIFRDRRDRNRPMTSEEKRKALEIERMLETTGFLLPDERPSDRDSFRTFIKKFVRDTLTYDQACIELIRDRTGQISRFIQLPSETIRPAVADTEHMDPAEYRSRVAYVQVYENTVISEFSTDDLGWCVMNPRSDLRVNGFGFSPIEQVTRMVTSWLFAMEHNSKFFSNGAAIKGLLNIKGTIPDRQLRAFRRMWYSMVSGTSNAWKTPILNSEDIQWVSMHSSNRDMEFGAYVDYLTKLTCACFGIDPVEINFVYGSSGGSGTLFDRRPNQSEVTESKDKGLRPLLDHVADCINRHIVWDIDPSFEFSFVGLDAGAEAADREARIAEAKGFKFIDEVRADAGLAPLPDELGQMIEDPTWLQWAAQKAQEQNPQPGMDDGSGGPPGAFGGQPGGPPPGAQEDPNADGLLSAPDHGPDEGPASDDLLSASFRVLDHASDILRKATIQGDTQTLDIEIRSPR